jgi:hypothetical protein
LRRFSGNEQLGNGGNGAVKIASKSGVIVAIICDGRSLFII